MEGGTTLTYILISIGLTMLAGLMSGAPRCPQRCSQVLGRPNAGRRARNRRAWRACVVTQVIDKDF